MNQANTGSSSQTELFQGCASLMMVLSVLSGTLYASGSPLSNIHTAGILFGAANFAAATFFKVLGRTIYMILSIIFYGAQLGIFSVVVTNGTNLTSRPVILLLVGFIHAAIFLLPVLTLVRKQTVSRSLGFCLLFVGAGMLWEGTRTNIKQDRSTGEFYLQGQQTNQSGWWLRDEPPNVAQFTLNESGVARVEIVRSVTSVPFDIQLNLSYFQIQKDENYQIQFEARSDRPRMASVGVARGYKSWSGLGFYNKVQLTPEWKTFHRTFKASGSEALSRIHFDLGGNDASVEISSVKLIAQSTGNPVEIQPTKQLSK